MPEEWATVLGGREVGCFGGRDGVAWCGGSWCSGELL
jgi:hypothetical protein